jgi:DNA-binding MarR family transcriptional regulator
MARVHKPPRSASEKAYHQREIARMYLKEGKTQTEIAAELKIDQATVSRDLKDLKKGWAKEAKKELQEWQGQLLTELQLVKVEAWQGWENSQGKKTTIQTSDKTGSVKEEDLIGNPSFLAEVRQSVMAQYKVLGLDQITIILQDDLTQMSDEEVEKLAKGR